MKGKNVIITGASKGIGRALAILLASNGANVVLVARSQAELQEVKQECEANGASVLMFVGSVADEYLAKTIVEQTISTFGSIDFLVNNAGFGIFGETQNLSSQAWDSVMETNAKGTFLFSKYVISPMKAQKSGHILNIESDVAKRAFVGGALYCASKYAQEGFTQAIRKELRPFNIKVSGIYSGLVDTPFHSNDAEKTTWLQDLDMANSIYFVMNQPAHVVIDELMIHPMSQDY